MTKQELLRKFRNNITKINKDELVKVFNKYADITSFDEVSITKNKNGKYILTMKKFEIFLRIYVNKNIQVFIRTNSINSQDGINYDFVIFDNLSFDLNINEYKKSIKGFFNSLVKEVNNMTFLPEDHIRTDYNPIDRLLTEVSYHNYEDFQNWLK